MFNVHDIYLQVIDDINNSLTLSVARLPNE